MLKQGTQIIYIPDHANGDKDHPDCEYGFVTSVKDDDNVFCRYWNNPPSLEQLRTRANSELTSIRNLVKNDCMPQEIIDSILERIQ